MVNFCDFFLAVHWGLEIFILHVTEGRVIKVSTLGGSIFEFVFGDERCELCIFQLALGKVAGEIGSWWMLRIQYVMRIEYCLLGIV